MEGERGGRKGRRDGRRKRREDWQLKDSKEPVCGAGRKGETRGELKTP